MSPSRDRLARIWRGMYNRCTNTEAINYEYYGGRGISVCAEWSVFEKFYTWAINSGYDENKQIDRINNNGNYSPDNCQWCTAQENANNRSNKAYLKAWGERKSLADWVKDDRCKVDYETLRRRKFRNWEPERALTEKAMSRVSKPTLFTFQGETKTLTAWARDKSLNYKTLHRRINVLAWPLEKALTA